MTRRLTRIVLGIVLAAGTVTSISCKDPLEVLFRLYEEVFGCDGFLEDFAPPFGEEMLEFHFPWVDYDWDDCRDDSGAPVPGVSPPTDPGPTREECAALIDEDPANPVFGVDILFVGSRRRTQQLYTIWKDLELKGDLVPLIQVRNQEGQLVSEGNRPFLAQDDLHVDYHIERPGQCASQYVVNCGSAGDRACLISVPQLGLVRIITPDLDELLSSYGPEDEAIIKMMLRLTKLGEVYIHEGAHAHGPHLAPGLDADVHGPYGAGLIASTKMLTGMWDLARRASPTESLGPFSQLPYQELLTTVGQTRMLDAYLLNWYTLWHHVVDQVAVVPTLLPHVHRDFQSALLLHDPDEAIGRVQAEYLDALVRAAY